MVLVFGWCLSGVGVQVVFGWCWCSGGVRVRWCSCRVVFVSGGIGVRVVLAGPPLPICRLRTARRAPSTQGGP